MPKSIQFAKVVSPITVKYQESGGSKNYRKFITADDFSDIENKVQARAVRAITGTLYVSDKAKELKGSDVFYVTITTEAPKGFEEEEEESEE